MGRGANQVERGLRLGEQRPGRAPAPVGVGVGAAPLQLESPVDVGWQGDPAIGEQVPELLQGADLSAAVADHGQQQQVVVGVRARPSPVGAQERVSLGGVRSVAGRVGSTCA